MNKNFREIDIVLNFDIDIKQSTTKKLIPLFSQVVKQILIAKDLFQGCFYTAQIIV